jgi:hypothetical protein
VVVEKRSGLLQAVGLNASRGQLDRKCHPVKLSADAHHDCDFRVAEVQASATRHRAFHEQLGRGERPSKRRCEPWIVRWASKRIQSVDALTLDLKSLATCRQDVDLRCGVEDACRQGCHRFNEMFAGIEDQENPLVLQICAQAGRCIFRLN